MGQTLNDTQRKLVENNHNLIFSFLNSRHLSLNALEDWYGVAAIGLCKAALIYDETRGAKFASLAYVCMDNEVRVEMRKNKKCVNAEYSLEYEYGEEGNTITLVDILCDDYDFFESIELNDAVSFATRSLSDRDKGILNLIFNFGYTQEEAGTTYNITRGAVSNIYRKFVKKVKEYFN